MDTDVAVIGAGAAGLAAFHRLRQRGLDAVLIEARDRLGGRIHTVRPPDWPAPVELGAEFIHGNPPELLPLAEPKTRRRRDFTFAEGTLKPAGELAGGADAVFSRMRQVQPPQPDLSFEDFLATCADCPAPARARARAFIEGFEAADPKLISVYSLNLEQQAEEEDQHFPAGGFATLIEGLAGKIAPPAAGVYLDAPVQLVRWRAGEVCVEASHRGRPISFRARRAIVTLPLSLLQSGQPRFIPALEAKRAAFHGLIMGAALRVTLRCRRPFWPEDMGFLFSQAEESGHFPTWWTRPSANQITGWAASRHALSLAGRPPNELRMRAIADLARLLQRDPEDLQVDVSECHVHDWQADPYAQGAYSYARAGSAEAHAWLAAPLAATLHFAGEATDAQGHHATVQGALRSGLRAADEIPGI